MNESTATLTTSDGLDLHVRRWEVDGVPHHWTFVVVHGHGEHGGRYRGFAEWFGNLGGAVYAMDHRGHGRSGGQRGHTPSLDALLDDIDLVLGHALKERGGPVVLVGHSLGGLLAIAYTLRSPDRVERAVFSAPALVVKLAVPAWKKALAGFVPKVAPRASFSNEVDPALLSHDPDVVQACRDDPLVHSRISAQFYDVTMARGEDFIRRAPELRVPFLLLHGAQDQVIDPRGSQRFFARATVAERAFCLYPGFYHEIFNEVGHERVFQDIESWLTQQTDAQVTGWNPPP